MSVGPEPREAAGAPQPLAPGLYIVATPIGNLRDVTLRALDVLAGADRVLAEDTRVAQKLLDAYGIKAALEPYHEHNAEAARPRALARLAAGERVALVSDAGTPLVSDPGFKLVREAAAMGAAVYPIPGASALLAGLVASGLPTDRFLFAGFLPAKPAGRRTSLAALAAVPATLVFFETGPRLARALADMAEMLGDRPAAVARELTKLFEETRRGPLAALANRYAEEPAPKGEIVVIVGPPAAPVSWDFVAVDAALAERMGQASMREAVDAVAALSGRPRREVYARALALRGKRDAGDA